MDKFWKQAQLFWQTRDNRQRGWLVGGAAATVALLVLLTHLVLTPEMKPVMSGMEPADAQALSTALAAKGIHAQLSTDGKGVLVPADKLDAARLEAVSSSAAPHSGRMGFEIFDKVSWGQTEFDEKVNYQRALEGELERTIMTMGAVKSARVHLVMAADSVFLDQAHGAKASITVQLKSGATLTHEEISAIQRLVAGAVDQLKPADVAIIDADSNKSLGTGADGDGDNGEMEKRLEGRVLATLTPVLGADHVRASVNIEYEPGTTEQSSEEYDPKVSVPLSVQRSDEETGAGAGASGVPGTTSNIPDAKGNLPNLPPGTAGAGTESLKNENSTFGVNKVVSHSLEPAGRLKRITAALLVDDATVRRPLPKGKFEETRVKRSPEELKQIEDLASAALGLDKTRGDSLTVEDMSFAAPPASDLPTPTMLDKARKGLNDFSDVLRYGFLLTLFALAYLLVLRPMQKRALAALPAPALAEVPTLPVLPKIAALPIQPVDEDEQLARANGLKDQLSQLVKAQPQHSVETVQAWLRGEEV
jgi:flagellar M-ring protein FliF